MINLPHPERGTSRASTDDNLESATPPPSSNSPGRGSTDDSGKSSRISEGSFRRKSTRLGGERSELLFLWVFFKMGWTTDSCRPNTGTVRSTTDIFFILLLFLSSFYVPPLAAQICALKRLVAGCDFPPLAADGSCPREFLLGILFSVAGDLEQTTFAGFFSRRYGIPKT